MKFWEREREIGDLKRYLQSEPNAILFVFSPKSLEKSTLVRKVAEGHNQCSGRSEVVLQKERMARGTDENRWKDR